MYLSFLAKTKKIGKKWQKFKNVVRTFESQLGQNFKNIEAGPFFIVLLKKMSVPISLVQTLQVII